MKLLLVAALLLAVAARPADACSGPHTTIFEQYERATNVAIVRVVSVPARGAGAVALQVKRMLKGKKRAMLVGRENNTSCSVGYTKGKTALVFLDKAGHTVALGSYIEDFAHLEAALDAWIAATSDVLRRGVLVDTIAKGEKYIAGESAQYLVDEPALLGAIDADQKQQLDGVKDKHAMVPHVLRRIDTRNLKTTADKLAELVEQGNSETDPVRILAFERCERLHGKRLYPYTQYHNGVAEHFWKTLAKHCRTGTPHRW